MKQELQKQALELDKKREDEEMKKRREMAQIQMSSTIDVPSPGPSQGPPVSIEVPPNVLEVRSMSVHVRSLACDKNTTIYGNSCVGGCQ